MFRKYWRMGRPVSKSFSSFAPSWLVQVAITSCRPKRRAGRSGRIQEAACWAHVRRKFYDLEVAHKSPVAAEALKSIAGLYAIEKEIRGRPPDQRREVRNTRSRPLLESLKQWFEETLGKLSRKSDTTMAVRYALGR